MRAENCLVVAAAVLLLGGLSLPLAAAPNGFSPAGEGRHHPEDANGRKTETPFVSAVPLAGSLDLDGRLTDEAWLTAPAATGFRVWDPDRGALPQEETVFKVLYDENAVYFGVACLRLNGEPVTSCLSRRDNIRSSDRIRVYIDPYHDLTTGYHFRINPHGVKEDYYNFGDLYHDGSWDAVWEADTHIDE